MADVAIGDGGRSVPSNRAWACTHGRAMVAGLPALGFGIVGEWLVRVMGVPPCG